MANREVIRWRDKYPVENFAQIFDWAPAVGGAAITGVQAATIIGDVAVNDPNPTTFDGALQAVWVKGGTPGWQMVQVTCTTDDGETYSDVAGFMVL